MKRVEKIKRGCVLLCMVWCFFGLHSASGKAVVTIKGEQWIQELLETQTRDTHDADPDRTKAAFIAASKPVVWTTKAANENAVKLRWRHFLEKQYLENYRSNVKSPGSDNSRVLEFLNQWIDRECGTLKPILMGGFSSFGYLAYRPNQDPLIITLAGASSQNRDEQIELLDRALQGYETSSYKAYVRFHAAVCLAQQLTEADTNRLEKVDASARKLLKESLRDGSIRPEDQAEIAEVLINKWGRDFLDRNAELLPGIIRDAGKPFEWLSLMIEGESHLALAWRARGSGYSHTVTPEGWRGFEHHLAKARPCFIRAHDLRPDVPLAAYRMMMVSLGDSGITEIRKWFDCVIAAQPDYAPAWSGMRWALRPRWYGDEASMLAFGITAAATGHFETAIPRVLFSSIKDAESELALPPGQHIIGRSDVWPHVQKVCEGYLSEPSRSGDIYRLRSEYAVLAYLGQKYDLARQLLDKLHWQPWQGTFSQWAVDKEKMIQEVRMRTGPYAQLLIRAQDEQVVGNIRSALQIYSELLSKTNLDKETLQLARNGRAVCQLEDRFRRNGWIEFLPDTDDLAGWKRSLGTWKRHQTGAWDAQPSFQGHMLFPPVSVGTNFEVICNFEVLQKPNNEFQAGLVVGRPGDALQSCGFRVKHSRAGVDTAILSVGWIENMETNKPAILNEGTNSFYFRLFDGKISARVNDQDVFREEVPPGNRREIFSQKDFFLGIGARNELSEAVIRYNSVRLRRISSE